MKNIGNKTVLIGISSGIAGYKIVNLIRELKEKNIEVKIIMTANAVKMFGKKMFEKAVGDKLYTDLIPGDFNYKNVLNKREVEHIKLADSSDVLVIAPATANIIGKIACGFADDLLTTAIMAAKSPVLICPSMNVHMWENPIVQENINKLKSRGYIFIDPDSGNLACGYKGVGRLADIKKIEDEIINIINLRSRLKGKKILVTGGGTSESIDAVRFITNKGSGKMGAAIAGECKHQGADVLYIKAKSSISPELGIKEEEFENISDLEILLKKYVPNYDYLFHTAAVSDYIPERISNKKIDSNKSLKINFKKSPKLLHMIKSWNPEIKLIGFKAVYKETENNLIKIGINKLKASRSDYIVVNDVGRQGVGFGSDNNEVYIISKKGFEGKIKKTSKMEIARKLLDYCFPQLGQA